MGRLVDLWLGRTPAKDPERSLDWSQFGSWFTFNGVPYPIAGGSYSLTGDEEKPDGSYSSLARAIYKQNAVVFACMLVRQSVFSEARFQFRQVRSGRPGRLFGTDALAPLEQPWPGGTTGDLLTRAIQDVDLAGNFFAVRRQDSVKRLRPDWVTIVLGSDSRPGVEGYDVDAEVIGYVYKPGGPSSGEDPVAFPRDQVAHFAPIPDPETSFRGMSWVTAVLREVMADAAATTHKQMFFERGATLQNIVMMDPATTKANFDSAVQAFRDGHEGLANAYKTLILAGGTDVKVVGTDLRQLDFKQTQGAGETRIAAAAGTPPVIVGLSEGLQGSSLNSGNYTAARRRFADGTMRTLWRNVCGSLATIVDVPAGAELWYDDRDIAFLQEDQLDAAGIIQTQGQTIGAFVRDGFTPESAKDATISGDLSRLVHTGLLSVQLIEPGQNPKPEANGNGVPAGAAETRALMDELERVVKGAAWKPKA
jgi:phage portal protein BeeE